MLLVVRGASRTETSRPCLGLHVPSDPSRPVVSRRRGGRPSIPLLARDLRRPRSGTTLRSHPPVEGLTSGDTPSLNSTG